MHILENISVKVGLPLLLLAAVAVGIAGCSSATAGNSNTEGQAKPSIQKVFETAAELPSNKINVVIRHATFPVGFKTPEHTHDGPGPRYVLKGKVEVQELEETQTFGAGETFWESGALMTAKNVGDEVAELIIVELLPAE